MGCNGSKASAPNADAKGTLMGAPVDKPVAQNFIITMDGIGSNECLVTAENVEMLQVSNAEVGPIGIWNSRETSTEKVAKGDFFVKVRKAVAPVAAPAATAVAAPVETPAAGPAEEPAAAPVEAPAAAPAEAPVEAPTTEPAQASVAAPVAVPAEAPVAVPADAEWVTGDAKKMLEMLSTEGTFEVEIKRHPPAAPVETPAAAPVEVPAAVPVDAPTAAPVDAPAAAPVDEPAAQDPEAAAEAPADVTEAPAQSNLEAAMAPAEAPVEAAPEAVVEAKEVTEAEDKGVCVRCSFF